MRDHFGRVKVTSGYRSAELCIAIGSSVNSQHARAEAADFEVVGTDNVELFDWIKNNLEPDQLILEFYTPGEPNSGWIHCSWIPEGRRASFLHAYRSEGKTKYKPILGSAKEIFLNPSFLILHPRLQMQYLFYLLKPSQSSRQRCPHKSDQHKSLFSFCPILCALSSDCNLFSRS